MANDKSLIDASTGYAVSASPVAITAEQKRQYVELLRQGFSKTKAAEAVNTDPRAIKQHRVDDPKFRADCEEAKRLYVSDLEMVSRRNALNPKSVVERIFQLKANMPEKYGDKQQSTAPVVINIDSKMIDMARARQDAINAEIVQTKLVENKQEGE